MKIAFFVSGFPTVSETFIVNQLIALKNNGHTIHIFSGQEPKDVPVHQMILDAGLLNDTYYLDKMPVSRLGKITRLVMKFFANLFGTNTLALLRSLPGNKSTLSVYDLIPFLNKPRYDVVHAHFGTNGNYVTQLKQLGLFKKAKFVTTFHGYDLNENLKANNFYTQLFANCNNYLVNTGYSKKRLTILGCDPDKIQIMPAGLNVSYFRRSKEVAGVDKRVRLLFVGRLIKLKGGELFVEICRRLRTRPNIEFVAEMIGDGPMYTSLKRLIQQYELDSVVLLRGSKKQEEIIACMEDASIFVLPGITDDGIAEAQGLVIQEAQAMQLPVVISDAGGMAEGILNNITGFVVGENDIEGFVSKIELLANDPGLRTSMGKAGRKFVEENYDIERLNKKLAGVYAN